MFNLNSNTIESELFTWLRDTISKMRNKKVVFTVFLAIVVALVAYYFIALKQSAGLKAMVSTSAATMRLTTGTEVRKSIEDKQTTLGKPIAAHVIIEYEPKSNYSLNDVYDEIVKNLLEEHWQKEDLSTDQTGFFRADLQQDTFVIKASIYMQPDRGIVSIRLRTAPL